MAILNFIFSQQFASALEDINHKETSKENIRSALVAYKKAETIYIKTNGDLSRTVNLLLPKDSTGEDAKYLSAMLAMNGLISNHKLTINGTRIILSEKNNTYLVELEKIYEKEIKINNDVVKININFESGSLEHNYTQVQNDLNKYFKLKVERKESFTKFIMNLLLPRAEAFSSYLSTLFRGSGAALTSVSQRYYGGLRIDPSVGSGTGRPSLPPRNAVNKRYFKNYTPPTNSHSAYYNRGPAPVYQKPNGTRIQTWGTPSPNWHKVTHGQ